MGALNDNEFLLSGLLLEQLYEEFNKPEFQNVGPELLATIIDDMESIKRNMQIHWLRHKQIKVVEQMIAFDSLINYARKLQNKNNDVASM
jgi:hypothetical protein